MKAAIYSRKSKFTGKGESIENQIEMCKEYCNRNYDKKVEFIIYEDEGFSGGNIDRPQFQKLILDAKNNKFDALVCYRLDRISRNVADFSATLELLEQHNIAFVSIKEQFDTSTPMGKAMVYIASVFAQLERETIAERVRDNMLELAKTGRWLGGPPPMGFTSEKILYYDSEMKEKSMHKLSPIPEELEFVKSLYKKYLEVGSIHKVRKYLLQNNIKTRNEKDFSSRVIVYILRNPAYVMANNKAIEYLQNKSMITAGAADGKHGLLVYNKKNKNNIQNDKSEWIAAVARHCGIIGAEEWLKVQRELDKNSKAIPALGKSNVALLTGLLKCKNCNNNMRIVYGAKSEDGTKRYYYGCPLKANSNGTRCNNKNANGARLDAYVQQELKMLTANEGLLVKQLQDFENKSTNNIESKNDIKALEGEISENENAIENLVKQLSQNENSAAASYIFKEIEKLDNENKELKNKLAIVEIKTTESNEESFDIDLMIDTARQFNKVIDTADTKLKKYLISTLVSSIYWDGDKQEAEINIFGSKKN
ncbi:recombinase family protein [Clostridium sp. Mt-5]|uniref:Recombinase family protein n=1 Tax=Clostridium moutaii TaxID=3240932 RepID=A0ABV4BK86_9CLOT